MASRMGGGFAPFPSVVRSRDAGHQHCREWGLGARTLAVSLHWPRSGPSCDADLAAHDCGLQATSRPMADFT